MQSVHNDSVFKEKNFFFKLEFFDDLLMILFWCEAGVTNIQALCNLVL